MMRVYLLRAVLCGFLAVTAIPAPLAFGQEPPSDGKKLVLTLDQCIKKAVEISPEIGESRQEVETYNAKKMQADAAALPQIELLSLAGPSPRAKKEQLFATDYTLNLNGVFGSADLSLVQPVYTFGRIGSYKTAAAGAIKASKAGVNRKTSEIILRTKEFYYSLLMARELRNLVLEIKDQLVDSTSKTEKQLDSGSGSADEVTLYKLRTFLGVVEKNLNDAEHGIALAKDMLKTSMGLPKNADFDVVDSRLTPEEALPEDISFYVNASVDARPEFIQLREGLHARNALVEAEKSSLYPVIFLGGLASISGATNRDRIQNPYISDFFSHSYAAAYMGLKWGFDFGIGKGKVKEAEAEYLKLAEKKRFADESIPLQVRKAYYDMIEAKKNINETEKAYKNARKWLITAVADFDMGIGEAKEIADAAVVYAQTKADYIRSVFNHRLSYANLLSATGLDLKELK